MDNGEKKRFNESLLNNIYFIGMTIRGREKDRELKFIYVKQREVKVCLLKSSRVKFDWKI